MKIITERNLKLKDKTPKSFGPDLLSVSVWELAPSEGDCGGFELRAVDGKGGVHFALRDDCILSIMKEFKATIADLCLNYDPQDGERQFSKGNA